MILAVALPLVAVLAVGAGAVRVSPLQCLAIVAAHLGWPIHEPYSVQQAAVVWSIRLPRVAMAMLVGASLGVSGAAMQGLFRNPLADPSLLGVSSGAAVAATLTVLIGDRLSFDPAVVAGALTLPLLACAGATLTTLVVYQLSSAGGQTVVGTMLLAGIAINALGNAFAGLLTFFASDSELRAITFWRLGSLGGTTWMSLAVIGPWMAIPVIWLPRLSRPLNALLLGESEAGHLGVEVERLKRVSVTLVAMAVGAAVASSGLIGFVGLVVPHLVRLLVGPDHRGVLPGSVLLGAILLLGADLVARVSVAPAELPVGALTAALGAPFFLWLLRRDRRWRLSW